MSLEEQVARLARAVELQGEASAVREIIRQRDEAQQHLAEMTKARDSWFGSYKEKSVAISRLERKNAALRGVVTRMKHERRMLVVR